MADKRVYQIGLTMIHGVGDILSRNLLQAVGNAEALFTEKQPLLEKIPGIGPMLAAKIKDPNVLIRAEQELSFVEKNQITLYYLEDEAYPARLKECPDAPVLFYFKGRCNLNAAKIVSLVGTRQITNYGRELTEQFVKEISAAFPDLLIVSGLAYGVDITAHRSALRHRLPTIGVLAHGLDRIYPPVHRDTAVEMLSQGGLLTDFPSQTNPDKPNFVRRNRIVAGMADATVVVESAEKGGSLITADIASSYSRDVYTFPGRVGDPHSKGCHALIQQNKAGLITSAADLIAAMRWDVSDKPGTCQQTELLFADGENESDSPIVALIRTAKEMHVNQLSLELGMPISQLTALLFELEMAGTIKAMPGNIYRMAGK